MWNAEYNKRVTNIWYFSAEKSTELNVKCGMENCGMWMARK